MARHYLDFIGLNTFIYEFSGWNGDGTEVKQLELGDGTRYSLLNTLGIFDDDGDMRPLSEYKNYRFADEQGVHLPSTASFFPALMLKRNGPYGYPTWKQIRLSENPLSRRQRKENIFTMVEEPGLEATFRRNNTIRTVRGKYGSILKYDEVPVSSRHKPIVVVGQIITDEGDLEKFQLKASYGNETMFFENDSLDKRLGLKLDKSLQYETVSGFYLNGGLDEDASPIDVFESFMYHECVWPPRVYTHKNYVRQRTTFSFPWRDLRFDRVEEVDDNGFESSVTQSVWPLDAYNTWDTYAEISTNRWGIAGLYGYTRNDEAHTDYGILQNQYSFGYFTVPTLAPTSYLDNILKVGPQYNRKHALSPSSSVVSPNGMKIEGINYGTSMGDMDAASGIGIPGGEAKWEAGSQSKLNPFYDSYNNYIQEVRQYGKDYSIIPEFRISDHVEAYQSKGLTEEIDNLFSLTGALENTSDSSKNNFYKIYSTSDFMKHFEMVKEDHKEFVSANSITLKCKAVKKFLPYEGFYPAQRSVKLSEQFYKSYKDAVAVSGGSNPFDISSQSRFLFQNLMVPTFAPGIFFNSIKAGVACDYPLIDSNVSLANNYVTQSGDDYYLKNTTNGVYTLWDRRIPFEAIVEPEKHLAGFRIYCNEPHEYVNNSGSVIWDGTGDPYYKLMAQNFAAETSDFFLKGKNFTSIVSQPSSNPTVGNAEAGKTYMMRIKMYKSKDSANIPQVSASSGFFEVPQYPSSSRETFTMYSRPSAFGPPQAVSSSVAEIFLGGEGDNYAFTPPYYYGQGWCDITFTATESRKYNLTEIIASSSARHTRFIDLGTNEKVIKTYAINGSKNLDDQVGNYGMPLGSSVNIFSQIIDEENSVDPNNPATRWAIQTKFETPILNFNHLSASTSITLPNNASQSVPRGMWHQYGLIEEDPAKGIFLQVDSVPPSWIDSYLEGDSTATGSLVNLCGFSTEAVKLGQIADEKKVYEAVVAVPFVEEDGERKFFRIPRQDIRNAQDPANDYLVGESVKRMVNRMQRYVMPPPMDFLNNPTVDPFAMYIFEFSHTFKKQDLANMWQNLYPEIGQTFETQTSTLTHELLAHELLGGGAKQTPDGLLDINAVGNEIPDRVRWMVFKAKQRAKINYYEKIIGRNDELPEATVTSQGANVQVSYNWPYDFFSLVELAKLESEVKFAKRQEKSGQEPRDTVESISSEKVTTRTETASRNLIQEGIAQVQSPAQMRNALNQSGIRRSQRGRRDILSITGVETSNAGTGEYYDWDYDPEFDTFGQRIRRAEFTDVDGDGWRDPEFGGRYEPHPRTGEDKDNE